MNIHMTYGSVCIASIMRLVSVVRQDQGPDAPWHWVDQGLWAISEGHFAIISGTVQQFSTPKYANGVRKRVFLCYVLYGTFSSNHHTTYRIHQAQARESGRSVVLDLHPVSAAANSPMNPFWLPQSIRRCTHLSQYQTAVKILIR